MDTQKLEKGILLKNQIAHLKNDIAFLESRNVVPEVTLRMEFPFKNVFYLEDAVLSHEYIKKLYITKAKYRLSVLSKELDEL